MREKNLRTFGEVADANKGNKPPQAIIRLSANCEIRWTVFTTKMAFSLLFTKSNTDFVEWLQCRKKNYHEMLRWKINIFFSFYFVISKYKNISYLLHT